MRRTAVSLLFASLLLLPFAAACSSDTTDNAKDAVESAKDDAGDAVDTASARGQAEALRASLEGNQTADDEGVRSVSVLEGAVDDLPGDPDVSGIDDSDGDGLDDDGKVQITVDDESACLTLPESGDDIDVTDGDC
jgi:hypothetical protein